MMKKNQTTSNQQQNLIEPPVVLDLKTLLMESKLSENEIGIIKRRLLENSESLGKVLQLLAKRLKQETGIPDLPESLKQLKEKEGKEIRSFDSIATVYCRS